MSQAEVFGVGHFTATELMLHDVVAAPILTNMRQLLTVGYKCSHYILDCVHVPYLHPESLSPLKCS